MTKYEYRKLYLHMLNIGNATVRDITIDRAHINLIKAFLKKKYGNEFKQNDSDDNWRMYQ